MSWLWMVRVGVRVLGGWWWWWAGRGGGRGRSSMLLSTPKSPPSSTRGKTAKWRAGTRRPRLAGGLPSSCVQCVRADTAVKIARAAIGARGTPACK
jgi:hypothetical protein